VNNNYDDKLLFSFFVVLPFFITAIAAVLHYGVLFTPAVEKQKAYKQWLQQNTVESKDRYKEKCNHAKTIIREAHQQSWDKFISNIEDDLHGR
jgi:hypothetical protein